MGKISGLPQDQVFREALKTVSKSTGFSDQPKKYHTLSKINLWHS
jgi:hypothetical protein